jgi:hypothetical protein
MVPTVQKKMSMSKHVDLSFYINKCTAQHRGNSNSAEPGSKEFEIVM